MSKSISDYMDVLSNDCTACRACEQICPQKCINIIPDEDGFLDPVINERDCVECGLCVTSCHVLNEYPPVDLKSLRAYYAWADEEKRYTSSSGGAFSSIVEAEIKDDGYVFGAAFTPDWKGVEHKCCDIHNYLPLRKSKYVFCDPGHSFTEIRTLLKKENKVIFSGTPCQVSALKCFLRKDYDNLITIDFICHGVASTKFYREHLEYITGNKGISEVDFRPKGMGWDPVQKVVVVVDGTVIQKDQQHDFYMHSFFNNKSMRKCCYSCHYTQSNHQSDITLADFWRAGQINPELMKEPGISLIICNTDKGKNIINNIDFSVIKDVPEEFFSYVFDAAHKKYNINDRTEFYNHMHKRGLDSMEKAFRVRVLFNDSYIMIKRLIKKIIGRK